MSRRISILLALPLLLAGGSSLAGPAAPAPDAKAPSAGQSDRGPDMSSVPGLQRRVEQAVAELGALGKQAEADGDATRAACVKGWQQKGQVAMEVATGEIMVLRDGSSTAQQKSFAVEKLAATAERLDTIVSQARKCGGDQAPEDQDDVTTTEVDQQNTIPIENPTLGGGASPVPPAGDPNLPTSAASPSM